MRRIKKLVALILSVALISSLCVFQLITPVAAEEENVSSVVITDDELLLIEKLEAFGVISNEYDPSSYATRREMAEIIAKYIALPSGSTVTTSPFGDVPADDRAIGAISGLYNMGVITGDENGNFHPDNDVTYDEALVFIINAVGHKIFAQRSGGYPTGYHRIAIQHDMLDDISMSSGKEAVTFIDIYKMLNAALSAAQVETVYYGDGDVQYTLSTTETFLSENYGIKKYRGKVTGNEWTRLESPESNLTDEQIEIDNEVYDTPGYIYGYFLGYSVDYYLSLESGNETELIYIEETPNANSTVKIYSDDILASKTTSSRIYYENGEKEEHIDFISYMDVIYNSQSHTGYGMLENILPTSGYIEALDNNNDGLYEVLFVYEYKNMVVKSIDLYNRTLVDEITGTILDLDDEENVRILSSTNGSSIPFGSISKGKVLSVAEGKSANGVITVYVSNDAVSGKITGYNSVNGYEINGNFYKAAPDYYGNPLDVGVSGKFLLDISGKIATYGYDGSKDSENIAVTAGIHYETSAMKETVVLRIFTCDGSMKELNLKKKIRIDGTPYDLSEVTERLAAVAKLCNNYIENGMYKINDSYVIKYTLDDDNNINYIDMGGSGAPGVVTEGSLNILADHYTAVRVNNGSLLSMYNDRTPGNDNNASVPAGENFTTRMSSNKVIFVTPEAGNLDDVDAFDVIKSMSLNHFYANADYFVYAGDQVGITDFSAYSFGKTEFPMVDVMLLRGTGAVAEIGNNNVALNVISHFSEVVNEDGEIVSKLYQGDTAIGVLPDSVSYTRNSTTKIYGVGSTENLTIDDLLAILEPGDVIQVSKDSKGYIQIINAVSEYDYTNDALLPIFNSDGRYIKTSSMYNQPYNNFVVGTVKGIDKEAGILSFDAGTYTGLVGDIATAPVVYVFDTDKQKLRVGNIDDIQFGDVFTLRTWSSFYVKEVIVFR